jgi:hypothetical protein
MKRASPDVQIEAGGQPYTLRFSAKALAAMQDHWGLKNLDEVGTKLGSLETGEATLADYTAILWSALRTHHPEVTIDGALDLLDEMGIDGFMDALSDTLSAGSTEGGGDASADPPRPGRSIGSSNSAAKSGSRRRS